MFLIVHFFAINVFEPGPVKSFNQVLFDIYNFDPIPSELTYDKWTGREPFQCKQNFEGSGYESLSIMRNMGLVFVLALLLPVRVEIMMVLKRCFFKGQRNGFFAGLLANTSRMAYLDFIIRNILVITVSSLITIRYVEDHFDDRLNFAETMIAVSFLIVTAITISIFFVVFAERKWYNLEKKLRLAQLNYSCQHKEIITKKGKCFAEELS